MTSSADGAASLRVRHLCFRSNANVMVRTANRYRVRLSFILRTGILWNKGSGFAFLRTLRSNLTNDGGFLRDYGFLFVASTRRGSELRFNSDLIASTFLFRLNVSVIRACLVRLVGNRDGVGGLIELASSFNGTARCLAIIGLSAGASTRTNGCHVSGLRRLRLVRRKVATCRVNVTLVRLAVTSFLQAINTPRKLCLVAFREGDCFVTIRRRMTNGECYRIVTRAFLTGLTNGSQDVATRRFFVYRSKGMVAKILCLRRGLITFLAVLPRRNEGRFRQKHFCLLGAVRVVRLAGHVRCVIALHRFCKQRIANSFQGA